MQTCHAVCLTQQRRISRQHVESLFCSAICNQLTFCSAACLGLPCSAGDLTQQMHGLPAHSESPAPALLRTNSKTFKPLNYSNSWLSVVWHSLQQPRWRVLSWTLLVALLTTVVGGSCLLIASRRTPTRPPLTKHIAPVFSTDRHHLLIYAFSNSDPQYLENLQYFIAEAVINDVVADHVIIVQEGPSLKKAKLPQLPPHAAYLRHPNECYDWGSYGWVLLQTGLVNTSKYRYFFFVNSSVRGPFLPAYARGWYHWMSAFTSRLNEDVKLVGSTISCEGSPLHGKRNGRWRRNPHVQSYAVATDQAGLQVLLQDPYVFACHRDRWDTIYYSELGASLAILKAGYNIDCLMLRYQGIDWRNKASWGCNARMSPAFEFSCDGTSLDPLEVMFVKVKSYMLDSEMTFSKKAAKYQQWQQQSSTWQSQYDSLVSNEYVDDLSKYKAAPVLIARARNANCFDFTFYAKENPDLKPMWGDIKGLWRHWVYYGQFDYRPHKWLCDIDYRNISRWPAKD